MIQNFYIHIGTYKTGTTSIQQLLLKHEQQLTLNDIYVIDRERDLPEVSKWLFPEWYDIEDMAKQESKAIHQILAVKKEFIACENVVYSEENFTDLLSIKEQQSRAKKLKFIIDIFSARSTELHVFYRAPKPLLLSWYKQLLRNRNFNYPNYQYFLDQNIKNIKKSCDWKNYTSRLEIILDEHIKTHCFESACKNGLIQYFFKNILNINSIKLSEKSLNKSQSDLKTKLMESISKLAIKHKLSPKNVGWMKQAVFDMEPVDMSESEMYKMSNKNTIKLEKLSKKSDDFLKTKGNNN